jgi:hypothetical protein
MAEPYHPGMKGDGFRALCTAAEVRGYAVKLFAKQDNADHTVLSSVAIWKDGEEVEVRPAAMSLDEAAVELMRWLSDHDEKAAA